MFFKTAIKVHVNEKANKFSGDHLFLFKMLDIFKPVSNFNVNKFHWAKMINERSTSNYQSKEFLYKAITESQKQLLRKKSRKTITLPIL